MVDLSTITVLVIDEKRGRADGVREAVQRILPDATILVARPGDPWMEMAASRDPDMILVDTSTPGADGLDICRRLKKDERLSAIPVVAMTNREACMDTLSSALEAGIQGFLVEPLDPAQLLAQILSMARLKNSSRESQREFDRMLSMKAGHESALHASEKKYKALISRMMNAFALHEMIFDDRGEPVDYRFLEVNPAWERVVGIEANKVIGKTIKEIMPTIEEKWIRLYGRVVKTGISEEFTDYNAATNKYYEVYAFAVSGDQFAVFFNDVTPQIKTDLRLKESEEKFRSIAEALSDLIALTDEAGVIAYASPASSSIFGADPKEMAGRHFTDFVADSSISKAIEAFRAAISGEQRISKQEFLLKRLDGSLFFGEVTGAAHTIGSTHGALVTIRDIDERKQAEKQKQKQQARLQSFVRIIQHQSDSIQQFLDYALEELIQLTESQIGYICFYNENKKEFTLNTWSKSVMERCSLPPDSKVYRLENTGIWGEAVRQRKEIIVNDFSAPDPLKKGYPDGHVHLRNFLTVPIFEENQIVAVAGVGNKDGQYDEDDVLQMRLLMSNVWKEVVNKKGVLALAESEKRFSIAQELSPDGFTILRPIRNEAGVVEDFIWVYENPAVARINGTVPG
ncbi:MAG TPA: PAS domain S-box protein, partial [Rectinemataceae bacterium]